VVEEAPMPTDQAEILPLISGMWLITGVAHFIVHRVIDECLSMFMVQHLTHSIELSKGKGEAKR